MFGKKKKTNFELISNQIAIITNCLDDIEYYLLQTLDCFGFEIANPQQGYFMQPEMDLRLSKCLYLQDENGKVGFLLLGATRDLKGIDYYPHTSVYFILNGLYLLKTRIEELKSGDHNGKIITLACDLLFNIIFLRTWLSFAQMSTSAIRAKDIEFLKKIRVNLQNLMLEELEKLNPKLLAFADFKQIGIEYWMRIPYIIIEPNPKPNPEFYNIPMNEIARQDIINYQQNITMRNK